MFNFHKPRVFRSAEGCCICRAKSSSSRFTDSRKYENDSMKCFNLKNPRHGEICNACVLLVKRFKRLPLGSKRHWGHVVDARGSPGTKSLNKQKKSDSDQQEITAVCSNSLMADKFTKIFKKNRSSKKKLVQQQLKEVFGNNNEPNSADGSDNHSDSNESYEEVGQFSVGIEKAQQHRLSLFSTISSSSMAAETIAAQLLRTKENEITDKTRAIGSKRRRILPPVKYRRAIDNVTFFDSEELIKHEICCGTIYEHPILRGFIIIDSDEYQQCEKHRKQLKEVAKECKTISPEDIDQIVATITTTATTTTTTAAASRIRSPLKQPTIVHLDPVGLNGVMTDRNQNIKSTTVLKKHHLFFKRQSESFPRTDIKHTSPIPLSKTDHLMPSSCSPPLLLPSRESLSINSTHMPKRTTETVKALTSAVIGVSTGGSTSKFVSSVSAVNKFNDNSSDSGFEEHMQEHKSASPLTQDEQDKKQVITHSQNVQRLILASGLQITGQSQNLLLAGNEFTAHFIQQRQQKVLKPCPVKASANILATNSVHLSVNSNNKMRTVRNNNENVIKHENDVTTILPANSLAADNQTTAISVVEPSTVMMTPAVRDATLDLGKKITNTNATNLNQKLF